MAELVWDQTGERYWETGTDKVALYVIDDQGKYSKGVAWNGATGVEENPSGGEATKLYADNSVYATLYSNEEFACTVKAYTYPDEFEACDGSVELANGVKIGQQARKAFGLAYRTKVGNDISDDAGYKLHLVYGCKASPSAKSYATVNDSPEAIEFSYECTSTPVTVSGHKPTSTLTIDSRYVDASKLALLEAAIYGSAEKEAYLPLPDEVLDIIGE